MGDAQFGIAKLYSKLFLREMLRCLYINNMAVQNNNLFKICAIQKVKVLILLLTGSEFYSYTPRKSSHL